MQEFLYVKKPITLAKVALKPPNVVFNSKKYLLFSWKFKAKNVL